MNQISVVFIRGPGSSPHRERQLMEAAMEGATGPAPMLLLWAAGLAAAVGVEIEHPFH